MALLKRSAPGSVSRCKEVAAEDCKLPASVPAICEFLMLEEWEDGKARKTGSITLFGEEGQLKAWVNDKDGGRTACVSGATLRALLAAIEKQLPTDGLDWRKARPSPQAGKR
jgi:hypothetical protein